MMTMKVHVMMMMMMVIYYSYITTCLYIMDVLSLGLDGGTIAGIVIAVLIVVIVLILLGIYIGYKHMKKSDYR